MQLGLSYQGRNSNIMSRSARGILSNKPMRSEANLGMSTSSVGSSKSRASIKITINSQNRRKQSEVVDAKTVQKAKKFVTKHKR